MLKYQVNVTLHRKTGKIEHNGIKIEFIGQIELYYDRGNHHEFLSLVKELARPGELTQNTSFDFEFNQVEKPYETNTGAYHENESIISFVYKYRYKYRKC